MDVITATGAGGLAAIIGGAIVKGADIIIASINKKGNNGVCKMHMLIEKDLASLVEMHKDEKRIEIITQALEKVLDKRINNGI